MRYFLSLFISCFLFQTSFAQEQKVFQSFQDTRIINMHSVETLKKGKLDMRITHRFGDIAGDSGGWPTFYGLENASDILIGFDYGVTDNFLIGLNRTKGSVNNPLKQNLNGILKIRLIQQEINGNQPFSFTVLGMTSYSTMQKSDSEGVLNFFEKNAHRFTHHLQLLLARKFGERFTFQLSGAWTYRNIVPASDQNDIVSAGAAIRLKVSKAFGLIAEATVPISEVKTRDLGFYPAIGVGIEFDTSGGHVFQINVTNATGISETDYIPYTQTNWKDGEFRLGFTISRLFTL
jgi:hypothetical protein